MTNAVLLLNADYKPIKVIPWERAVCLLLDEKVYLLAEYAGKVIRSANVSMAFPAVVALTRYAKVRNKVRFNRANLLARDAYQCQYCATRPKTGAGLPNLEDLTIDHVVPRAQAKGGQVVLPWNGKRVSVTCWENVVAACFDCNSTKADRTPDQARMKLITIPQRPGPWDAIRMSLTKTRIPDEWRMFIPEDSGWRNYWDEELDSD